LSHIVTIRTEVRDPLAIAAACQRLGLPQQTNGTATLFSSEVSGLLVKLPGWVYPVVCDPVSGQLAYDNYNGVWGKPEELDRFLQAYAIEKARLEARKQGHTVFEQSLPNGSVKLTIQVGGGG
jgi:hypothetical protein